MLGTTGNLRLGVVFRLHFVFGVVFTVWCCLENRQVGEPLSRGKGLRGVKSKMPLRRQLERS